MYSIGLNQDKYVTEIKFDSQGKYSHDEVADLMGNLTDAFGHLNWRQEVYQVEGSASSERPALPMDLDDAREDGTAPSRESEGAQEAEGDQASSEIIERTRFVYAPQSPNAAQLEERRRAWVVEQISRDYDTNRESELARESIVRGANGEQPTQAFLEYHAYVEAVRAESHHRVESQDWSDYAVSATDGSTTDEGSSS